VKRHAATGWNINGTDGLAVRYQVSGIGYQQVLGSGFRRYRR
jgi:hypothetical protein